MSSCRALTTTFAAGALLARAVAWMTLLLATAGCEKPSGAGCCACECTGSSCTATSRVTGLHLDCAAACKDACRNAGCPVVVAAGACPPRPPPPPDLAVAPSYPSRRGEVPAHRWSRRVGGPAGDELRAVVADGKGGLWVAGLFRGPASFGGRMLVAAGGSDGVVVRLEAATGEVTRAIALGGPGDDAALGLAVGTSGEVYVVGYFAGTADLAGAAVTSLGLADGFVVGLSPDGARRFVRRLGGVGSDVARGVAVDGAGVVYVTGTFDKATDFGGGAVTGKGQDGYLASYGGDGTFRWAKRFGGGGYDGGFAVAADPAGALLTGIASNPSFDVAGKAITVPGVMSPLLAAWDPDGTLRYHASFAGERGNAVVADGMGGSFVAYDTDTDSSSDIYLYALDAKGKERWKKQIRGQKLDASHGLATDGKGNLYLAAAISTWADLGGGPLDTTDNDAALAGYTGEGQHRFSVRYGNTDADAAWAVAVDGGAVYAVGACRGAVDFGGGPLAGAGDSDGFVLRLGP